MNHQSFLLPASLFLLPASLFLASACTTVSAAPPVKPGLWEISTRMMHADKAMQDAMAQMQKQMASMPPEQRKQMEAMFAQQGMAMDGKGGMRVKSCVTPEQAAQFEVPAQDGDCKTAPVVRSGNTMNFSYTCTDPLVKGQGSVTFTSPTAYTMRSESTAMVDGKAQKTRMEADGRWLSADCTGAMNAPAVVKRK